MKGGQVRAIVLVLILLSIVFVGPTFMSLAIVPGPEGLNLEFCGVQFAEYSNTFWELGEIRNNQVLESLDTSEGFLWGYHDTHVEMRCVYPNPYNTEFRKDLTEETSAGALWPTTESHIYSTLLVERERPTIPEVNIHGDPLGAPGGPTDVRYIEYHTPRVTEGNQITFTKYVIHVVPVDFIVQMSVRGDRWAGWSDTHLWFKLDTVVWRNAFTGGQVEQIQEWLDKDPPEGATISGYSFRGGFPIWGWVGEWDPIAWYDEEERETQPPQEAYDNVRIYPSLEGREITLYTTPSYTVLDDGGAGNLPTYGPPGLPDPGGVQAFSIIDFPSDLSNPDIMEDYLVSWIPDLPDPDFATTVYTPIYIEKFYPYYEEGGWGSFYQRKEWYPTTYMRVRILYALYGEYVYLWSEEEAESLDYEWETRSSQYKYEEGPWVSLLSGVGSWFTSPFGILSMLLFGGLILMAILVVLNPALLLGLFKLKGGRRR